MKSLPFFLLTLLLWLPLFVLAASGDTSGTVKYAPLIEIKGLTDATGGGSFSAYVDFLYGFSIAIAALLAVIKIVVAGVKYMLSSLPGTKGNAKDEITGALLGLLLILGAYLILNTINPALTKTTVSFDKLNENPNLAKRPAALQPAGAAPVGTQTANTGVAQFDTGFPSCATIRPGTSGTFDTRALNTTGCPIEERQRAILRFNSLCGSLSGTPTDGNDTNSQTLACAIPKSSTPAVGATPTGTQTAAANCTPGQSTKAEGNFTVTTYDLTKCSNTTVNPALDNKTPFIYWRDNFSQFCKQPPNPGTFTSSSAGIYTCRVSK